MIFDDLDLFKLFNIFIFIFGYLGQFIEKENYLIFIVFKVIFIYNLQILLFSYIIDIELFEKYIFIYYFCYFF